MPTLRSALCGLLLFASILRAGEAAAPGKASARPTWACMSLYWEFSGDDDRDAKVRVAYRREGAAAWRPALGLWRVEQKNARMFSGSVVRLAPGTAYEFKLSFEDSDGGGKEEIVKAATKAYPAFPAKTVSAKLEDGLAGAEGLAEPGTVVLLPAGTYQAIELKKSGMPGAPIAYKAAGGGEVKIEGVLTLNGTSHLWFHGLTLENKAPNGRAINGMRNQGIRVTRCKLHAHYAIHTPAGSADYFIADNHFKGDCGGKFTFGGEGVDFGKSAGACGHAVCFNEFTEFADGVSYGRGHIDVYNNFIHETVDDFIEPDYGYDNFRLWENLCFNSMCGFSWQPMNGGPWYVFHNQVTGNYLHAFKLKEIYGPTVVCGNAIMTKSARMGQGGDILRGTFVNNLWLRATKGPLAELGRFKPGFSPTHVDHNAYGHGGGEPWTGIKYAELAKQRQWDAHSLQVEYQEVLAEEIAVPAGNPSYGWVRGKKDIPIPQDWLFKHQLLTIKPDSKLVDAGTVLPNISGPFLGEVPDIGAYEAGLGAPWTGPREWDEESGLVYGLPKGWSKGQAEGVTLCLTRESPSAFAHFRVEAAEGEARWTRYAELLDKAEGAETKVLEFQDGFAVRRCKRGGKMVLEAARVEPQGVLRILAGCAEDDWPKLELELWRMVRSLAR